jgi:hypothetical protein
MLLVLDLYPAFRDAGAVGQINALGDDAFKPEPASVVEDGSAIAGKVVDVAQPFAVAS